jgi:hypothetical protein
MAKNKTTETKESVRGYLSTIKDEKRQKNCLTIIDLVSKSTGYEAKMWGTSIVGFGSYNYKYDSGHEGSAPLAGLASRANAITLYLGSTFEKREELLSKFGKHKEGKGCIYIQKLEDVDTSILVKMFKNSIATRKKLYPA